MKGAGTRRVAHLRDSDLGGVQHVLFLCTGNSARSIMAECLMNRHGADRFRGHSAGSHPTGRVHPIALALLAERGYETEGLRSQSWDDFAAPGAPRIEYVFTVCDNAAGEACPVWPGRPITAHWGIGDPAATSGSPDARRRAFERAYRELEQRILAFLALRPVALDRKGLQDALDAIGKQGQTREMP
jgi:arsenate reductase